MKQLTGAFPTLDLFVSVYGSGQKPVVMALADGWRGYINGEHRVFYPGDKVVCFPWKPGLMRVAGLGFFHESQLQECA